MRPQAAITGLGPACAIGIGIDAFWESLCAGAGAVKPITAFDASGFRAKLAGEVLGVDIRKHVPKAYRKATKVMARDTELAVIAAQLAAQDAGLITRGSDESEQGFAINHARTGCQIGAGLIAAETEELARAVVSAKDDDNNFSMRRWGTEERGEAGMNNLPPLWLLKYLPNMLACHVTIIHGLEGPSNTIMGAEASAILSIGESTRVIERGDADICFTGGAESRINPLGLLRWEYAGRLADTGDHTNASDISRPYDPQSKGGVIGESGGMLVIENTEHARSRQAKVYALIEGFGAAQTPHPVFPGIFDNPQPDPIDQGLAAAIENALQDADLTPDDIDLILPLGLGAPNLDTLELGALSQIFGDRLSDVPLLPIAHRVGNTMAGHGGLMAAAAAMCLHTQHLPQGCLQTNNPPTKLRRALVCSGSLGGQTGALILRRVEDDV